MRLSGSMVFWFFVFLILSACTTGPRAKGPLDSFWVERENAKMPVWIRGNIESGVFIVFNHGGPGSSGTAESIFEVNPGNGKPDHPSPLGELEREFALVFWDQRHSGMSGGTANPDDSSIEDFGQDLGAVIDRLRERYEVKNLFIIGQSWGHAVSLSYLARTSTQHY